MNFLSHQFSSHRSRSKRRHFLGIGLFIIVLILTVATHYSAAQEVFRNAVSAKEDFLKAQGAIGTQDFDGAARALGTAHAKFEQAGKDFRTFRKFRFLPLLGSHIIAVENLLSAGRGLASGFQDIALFGNTVFEPLQTQGTVSLAKISPDQKRIVLQKLYESPPLLQGVKAEIDLAVQAAETIPNTYLLGPVKAATQELKERLPMIQKAIQEAIPAAEAIPQIAGYPKERTYLFLLQNNTELRPTGGFIGTYGILKLQDGEIRHFKTDNIYNLDDPVKDRTIDTPPWQIQKYLQQKKWFMRDSNWSPDFPTSAEKTEWFYRQEGGTENLDGVIAVTPTFIASLLRLVGDIPVDGITFTPDNLVETLEYQVERGFYRQGIALSERKEIIGTLATKLLEAILNLTQDQWPELWKTLEENIRSKHILVYLNDPHLEELVMEQGWGGEVKDPKGDFIFVVDANMASLKSDPGVERTLRYEISFRDEETIGRLTIHYNNRGTFNWKSTRYRTYTRVYVPKGSVLLESQGAMDNDKIHGGRKGEVEVVEEEGKTQFGAFISIEPQEEGTLSLTYRLPSSIRDDLRNGNYHLLVQKQAGTTAYPLEVNITSQEKIKPQSPLDSVVKNDQHHITFSETLGEDLRFEVTLP